MVFANIEYLFLLLLLIPYIVWYILKQKKSEATLQISDARVYAHTPKSYKNYLLHVPFLLRCIALVLVILVLARPQTTNKWQNSEIEGIFYYAAYKIKCGGRPFPAARRKFF